MDVLEYNLINGIEVSILLIKKENDKLFNDEFLALNNIMKQNKFDFMTCDMCEFNREQIKSSIYALEHFANDVRIPFFKIDIPEYAMGYLFDELTENEENIQELKEVYNTLDKKSFKALNLELIIDFLEEEVQEKEKLLRLEIRPKWIIKELLDQIISSKQEKVKILHFTDAEIFLGLKEGLEDLGIEIFTYEMIEPEIKLDNEGIELKFSNCSI